LRRKWQRRAFLGTLLSVAALGKTATLRSPAVAAQGGVVTPDGRVYTAYVDAATKQGQFFQYTCEFDASWVVLATFGHDVPFAEQLEIVGHDLSIEPYYEETADGFVIYGGDVTTAFSGDYTSNMLARTTGQAMQPLFEHYDLEAYPVKTREELEAALDDGGLVWMKATVDFQPWASTIWITPDGQTLPTVLGNDHAVVAMGYNDDGVVIRDVLGPTNTNWERPYEYDVPWETFLAVFEAQNSDGIAVLPPGSVRSSSPPIEPASVIQTTG
jgi:hypothetical protein